MRKGFTLVEIMIVVAIIALLAAIAIPNLLRARLSAAQAYAQASLRTISTACESYAAANNGLYPASGTFTSKVYGADPKYINKDYLVDCATDPCQGYTFACTLSTTGYSCVATAEGAFDLKAKDYTITTGGSLTEELGT